MWTGHVKLHATYALFYHQRNHEGEGSCYKITGCLLQVPLALSPLGLRLLAFKPAHVYLKPLPVCHQTCKPTQEVSFPASSPFSLHLCLFSPAPLLDPNCFDLHNQLGLLSSAPSSVTQPHHLTHLLVLSFPSLSNPASPLFSPICLSVTIFP